MKHLLLLVLALTFVGCAAKPRTFSTGISKNPWILTLKNDGRYEHKTIFPKTQLETGQWWPINDQVVVMLPSIESQPAYFTRLNNEKTPFRSYWMYDSLRSAMHEHTAAGPLNPSLNVLTDQRAPFPPLFPDPAPTESD